MMGKRKVSEAELRLLDLAMTDVRPLKPRAKAPKPGKEVDEAATGSAPSSKRAPRLATPSQQAGKSKDKGSLAAIDRRTEQKLKRGRIAIGATLDLHGLKQKAAHARLSQFIQRASADGHKAVLVITGRGGPSGDSDGFMPTDRRGVLKAQVPLWIEEPPLRALISGVRVAGPRHGGAGALYIILKRPKSR